MGILFFDTETNGTDPKTSYICQLAAMLTDPEGNTKTEINTLIRPRGWEIPESAAAVHGITQEDCENYGIPVEIAVGWFAILAEQSSTVVAHNIKFDLDMLVPNMDSIVYKRFIGLDRYCTMDACTDIVKSPLTQKQIDARDRNRLPDGTYKWEPPGGWPDYKNPTLQECYQHFFGREFEDAHDAMADVRACRDIYFKVRETEHV